MKKIKRFIFVPILLIVILVTASTFYHVSPQNDLPESLIPMENLNCGDSMLKVMVHHGIPKVGCDHYKVDGVIDLMYDDITVLNRNMDCTYCFLYDTLCGIIYTTSDDNYNRDDFYNSAIEYFENNLTSDFVVNNEYCDEYEYEFAYDTGAGGEYITIYADDDCGSIQIYFQY